MIRLHTWTTPNGRKLSIALEESSTTFGRLGAALRKEGEKNQEMIQIFSTEVARLFGVIDRVLADGRPYLAGDYSIGGRAWSRGWSASRRGRRWRRG